MVGSYYLVLVDLDTLDSMLQNGGNGCFHVTVKENGCIIFISAIENDLLISSKYSLDLESHVAKGTEWLLKSLDKIGKSKDDLFRFLKSYKITLVCELIDQEFEEHVINYPKCKWGLYLHGINENKVGFKTWSMDKVREIAYEFGLFSVETLNFKKNGIYYNAKYKI